MHLVLLVLSDQKLNNIEQNTKMFQHEKSTTKKKFNVKRALV